MTSYRAPDVPSWPHGARELAQTLTWLRLCAIGGQALTVTVVALWLDLSIPVAMLVIGISALAAFAVVAFWRLAQPWPLLPIEAVAHIAVDTGVLGYLLYLTGGATNPFVSLLVMPITLAAAALALRYVAMVATLAVAVYLLLMRYYHPLPGLHPQAGHADFSLHVVGMAISFAITAAMLGYFIARLAATLREREASIRHERERALRDEGILAIATQAAGAAHELNTPLSTMRTLLVELCRERAGDPALAEDLDLLAGQTERCRDILRDLVAVGSAQLSGMPERRTLGAFVADCLDRFRLLRPEIGAELVLDAELARRSLIAEPGLRHAVLNLLNNAADASLAAGEHRVIFSTGIDSGAMEFGVRDFGAGPSAAMRSGTGLRFESGKRDGLGLGLALTSATAERLGGELIAVAPAGGGTLQRLRLPLSTLDNAAHGP